MVRDAETFADEDRKRREEIEVRNRADSLVYQTEKTLKDYGDKVSGDEKASIEAAITSLKDALTGSDQDKIKAGTEELERVSFKLAEAM